MDDFQEILKKMDLYAGFNEVLTPYYLRRECTAAISR